MQISVFSTRQNMTTKARTKFTFSPFVIYPLDFLLNYTSLPCKQFFFAIYTLKKYSIRSSVDSSNFTLFRKITAPGVYLSTGQKGILSNGQLFFFIILKWLVWPVKSKCARGKNVETIFTHFAVFSVVLILQAAYHFETKINDTLVILVNAPNFICF